MPADPSSVSLPLGPLPQAQPPGWTTPEFWTTVLTQVAALAIAATQVLLHRDLDAGLLGSVLPVAAIAVAAVAHAVYLSARRHTGLAHMLTALTTAGADATQIIALAQALKVRPTGRPLPAIPAS